MGWSHCGWSELNGVDREIGYGIEHDALVLADPTIRCDVEGCENPLLNRGIDYCCGGMHGEEGIGDQPGCRLYLCDDHHDPEAHNCDWMEAWEEYYAEEERQWEEAAEEERLRVEKAKADTQ